jgi:hypothetical protein
LTVSAIAQEFTLTRGVELAITLRCAISVIRGRYYKLEIWNQIQIATLPCRHIGLGYLPQVGSAADAATQFFVARFNA